MHSPMPYANNGLSFRISRSYWVLLVIVCQSCYQYNIRVPTDVSVVRSQTLDRNFKKPVVYNNLFWGVARKKGYSISAVDCIPPGEDPTPQWISSVSMKKTFGQSMITLLTLGIWSPININWECAPPCVKEAVIKP